MQFQDVSKAAFFIRGAVRHTSCELSTGLSELTGSERKRETGRYDSPPLLLSSTSLSPGPAPTLVHSLKACSFLLLATTLRALTLL